METNDDFHMAGNDLQYFSSHRNGIPTPAFEWHVKWKRMKSWNMELACCLIAIGYDLSQNRVSLIIRDGGTGLLDREHEKAVWQCVTIANSYIAVGKLKNSDTPANWIKWAKELGCYVEHLRGIERFPDEQADPAPAPKDLSLGKKESPQKKKRAKLALFLRHIIDNSGGKATLSLLPFTSKDFIKHYNESVGVGENLQITINDINGYIIRTKDYLAEQLRFNGQIYFGTDSHGSGGMFLKNLLKEHPFV